MESRLHKLLATPRWVQGASQACEPSPGAPRVVAARTAPRDDSSRTAWIFSPMYHVALVYGRLQLTLAGLAYTAAETRAWAGHGDTPM